MAFLRRTHTCGELRESHVGQTVVLNGWVNTYRSQQHQVFVDLRDRHGLTQIVFESQGDAELFKAAGELRSEWVLCIRGQVRARLPGKTNLRLETGTVEVEVQQLDVLNRSPNPPFEVFSRAQDDRTLTDPPELANEDLRLQYRYLDLRRPTLQRILQTRHKLNKAIRDVLDGEGFLELETPLLGRSTPEGARDYLVPSRVFPGQWYALPQSPQIYKQLLMVSGYDKYFQIARCLRDEDLRADRQPEFTQLDMEMSFVEREDILPVIERLIAEIFQRCIGFTLPTPIQRLSYAEAMGRYGSDKPDLRYALEIVDVTDLAARTEFVDFREAVESGGRVLALNAKDAGNPNPPKGREKFTRKIADQNLVDFARMGGKWAYAKHDGKGFATGVAKFLTPVAEELTARLGAAENDHLVFASGKDLHAAMGHVRCYYGDEVLKLTDPQARDFRVAWVLDFPSFTWDDEEKRWAANHHPFTSPTDEGVELLRAATEEDLFRPDSPLAKVQAKAYDLVINGYEAGGGSIRIHNPEVQSLLFRALGMTPEQARQRFGFLLDALKMGAPPHGGIALGLDRLTMILEGTTNIRDVIAFPKNKQARDLMTGAPAPVDARQLKELGL
jgi:aspartyl-tRNA synthetase